MHREDNNSIVLKQQNESLIKNLVDRFKNAFNSHDAKALASLLVEDGEWTDVVGQTTTGRQEIEDIHIYPFTTVLKEVTLDVKSQRSRWIKHDMVSIDIKWETKGHKTPDGDFISTTRYGLLTLIAKKEEKEGNKILKIVIAHNADYTSTYSQSDRNRIIKSK